MPIRGDRLRWVREFRNLTQSEIEKQLGMGRKQMYRYESGRTDITGDMLDQLATLLGTTTDYLLGRAEDPFPFLKESDLSLEEREVIAALRRGDRTEAIRRIVTPQSPDQPVVPID